MNITVQFTDIDNLLSFSDRLPAFDEAGQGQEVAGQVVRDLSRDVHFARANELLQIAIYG